MKTFQARGEPECDFKDASSVAGSYHLVLRLYESGIEQT